MYFNHYRIIKYVGFKSINCVINLDIVSSFIKEFDFLFDNSNQ